MCAPSWVYLCVSVCVCVCVCVCCTSNEPVECDKLTRPRIYRTHPPSHLSHSPALASIAGEMDRQGTGLIHKQDFIDYVSRFLQEDS